MDDELKAQLVSIYDRYAAERDGAEVAPWKLDERARFLERVRAMGGTRLLEIGAGPGRDGAFFQQQGLATVSTDLSPEMVARCRAKGLDARVMSFDRLEFPPGSFDAVWALNCLLHAPKRELPAILAGIRAVLRDGGLFYLGVFGGPDFEGIWPDDPYEPKRFFAMYPDEAIVRVATEVFELVDFRTVATERAGSHFQALTLRRRRG